jgi:predicted ATP-dependent endonuclease of OLD family
MQLSDWEVSGYRSIVDPNPVSLDKINVLVGKNNVGKSSFLDSILDFKTENQDNNAVDWGTRTVSGEKNTAIKYKLKFELNDGEHREVLEEINKVKNFPEEDIEAWFRLGYFNTLTYIWSSGHGKTDELEIYTSNFNGKKIPISFLNHDRRKVYGWPKQDGDTQIISNGNLYATYNRIIRNSVSSWKSINAFREPADIQMIDYRLDLDSDGQNLAQVLHTIRNNDEHLFDRISGIYAEIMEGVSRIRTPIKSGRQTTVAAIEPGLNYQAELKDISSGSKEVLTLITQILTAESGADVLLLEEPELHLHPGAERKVLDLISKVASQNGPQIFISTHSEVMVDESHADTIIRVDRNEETGKSSFHSISDEGIEEILIDLGYNNSSLYQASAVVFVEGRSDQAILEEFAITLAAASEDFDSFDDAGVTVHVVGGSRMESHGKALASIIGRLRIPYLFLIDSDDADSIEAEKSLKKSIGAQSIYALNKYSIESYLIESPEAIASVFSLDSEKVREFIRESSARPNKKSVLQDLVKIVDEGSMTYDEEHHGRLIARHIKPTDIPPEIRQLIEKILSMTC